MTTAAPQPTPCPDPGHGLAEAVAEVKSRAGRLMLGDEDLLMLCCEQISRSFTRDEKGYR